MAQKALSSTQKAALVAYERPEFLNSPPARILRILAEYMEPQARFRQAKIRDTIVFFGSARIGSRENAERALQDAQRAIKQNATKDARVALEAAKRAVKMSRYYEEARDLAKMLTEWSMKLSATQARFLICSGGGPGIMEAANRGAAEAQGRSVGLGITLPMEQLPNGYINPELNFQFHYFFMRKYWFAYLGKALVAFPGGFGTIDELFEILTLLQTSKIQKKVVVLIYGRKYWDRILNFQALVDEGVINASDLALFQFADSPQEAFEKITKGLDEYYLKPQTALKR